MSAWPAPSPQSLHVNVSESYAWCERFARNHYENFPVGSFLIPRSLRPDFYSIYAWSRTADDLADEGSAGSEARIAALDRLEDDLLRGLEGRSDSDRPFLPALIQTIARRSIPVGLLRDMLVAFRRDARGEEFDTMNDLCDYCRYSANPVGRLVLLLFGLHDDERGRYADDICTGLQLANFWQDLSVDLPRRRHNIPADILGRHGLTNRMISVGAGDRAAVARMISELVEHGNTFLDRGGALLALTPILRLRWELAAVVAGGKAILRAVDRLGVDALQRRPVIGAWSIARGIPKRLFGARRSSLV